MADEYSETEKYFMKLVIYGTHKAMLGILGDNGCLRYGPIEKARDENLDNYNKFYENIAISVSPNIGDWFTYDATNEINAIARNKMEFIRSTACMRELVRLQIDIQDVESGFNIAEGEDYILTPFDVSGMNPDISYFEITYSLVIDNLIEACRDAYEKVCDILVDDSKMLEAIKQQFAQCLINNLISW